MLLKKKIKKGDNVVVISGNNKGKRGQVSGFIKIVSKGRKNTIVGYRVLIQGINMVRRKKKNKQGEIFYEEKESGIHISNIAILDPKLDRATRTKYTFIDGKKKRMSVITGEIV